MTTAKKSARKSARQTSHCWPGFEPVPGKAAHEKGSCKPRPHQTKAEKQADQKAAAASRREKA